MSAEVVARTARGYAGGARPPATTTPTDDTARWARPVAWTCLALAGWVHVVASWSHLEEWALLGWGMAVIGMVQLATAWLVQSRLQAPSLVAAGTLVTVAALVFYVMSRTGDLPFLPAHTGHHGSGLPVPGAVGDGVPDLPGSRTEAVGAVDALCAGAQLAAVVAVSWLLPRRWLDVVTACASVGAVVALVWRLAG
ncbi:hypothetical protein [Nocardioides litoris]|uniref:hypothetical protein n=1 Tax=Nocardioides litoris TaxID=1926648 RepID=UPI00112300C4|nr:hypothetical protein [Nocardioides litoris]